jgi:2'-5' RNA ligase
MATSNDPPPDAGNDETLRLFIAVTIPPAVRQALANIRRPLEESGAPSSLRWVRPDGIHLTLKFLGATDAGRVGAITSALEDAAADTAAHELRIEGLGVFGGRRPRVLWAGLGGDIDVINQCAARVHRELSVRDFASEHRPFTPHLTLARMRDRASTADREALRRAVDQVAEGRWQVPIPSTIPVTALHLICSHLGPKGARYESLAKFPLSASAQP